jgi:hypothetical protein
MAGGHGGAAGRRGGGAAGRRGGGAAGRWGGGAAGPRAEPPRGRPRWEAGVPWAFCDERRALLPRSALAAGRATRRACGGAVGTPGVEVVAGLGHSGGMQYAWGRARGGCVIGACGSGRGAPYSTPSTLASPARVGSPAAPGAHGQGFPQGLYCEEVRSAAAASRSCSSMRHDPLMQVGTDPCF